MIRKTRSVSQVTTAHRQRDGAGFVVRRPFPTAGRPIADPFLMLDELGPVAYGPGEAVGAPDHPHRGFETVSYILEGEVEHEDSAGHRGLIGPGDVQWMTAGRGVIHSEMPSKRVMAEGGRVHGFQIWVNLPASDKMMAPRYQEIPKARIPIAVTDDGLAKVRVIAGEALGVSAVIETRTPIMLHHWTLRPGARIEVAVPEAFAAYAYVFQGQAEIAETPTRDGQLAVLGEGDGVTLAVGRGAEAAAEILLLGGVPLREPVVSYGPFVMNTKEQIKEAILDYQTGRMGDISRAH